MGVKGLTSFLRDNQTSLCKTVQLSAADSDEAEPTPVVVDAWSLPCPSGGEYLRFYKLVCVLIESWRSVGLEPTFVFDGATPPSKHDTYMQRLADHIRAAQLFYSTSPASRSDPSSSNGKVILPCLASQTFIHALQDLHVSCHFVPLGEADGMCVVIAERLGGYLFSQDSDFMVLTSTPGLTRVKGYCPFDMMMWVEDDPLPEREQEQGTDGDAWTIARGSKIGNEVNAAGQSRSRLRISRLIPSPELRRPKLVLTVVTPPALRQRLRIPANMLPLFGSLAGNDYTPKEAVEHFFEPGLDYSKRLEKVARIIREVVYSTGNGSGSPRNSNFAGGGSGSSGSSIAGGGNAGDHAVELVKRIVQKLCWKPFLTDGMMMNVVEAMIESTFQYVLPKGHQCCDTYPYCGAESSSGCSTSLDDFSLLALDYADKRSDSQQAEAKKAYAVAQQRGLANMVTHVWRYPTRIYLHQIMEDPYGPSLRCTEGSKEVRAKGYGIVEDAMGMIWPDMNEDEDEDEDEDDGINEDEDEVADGENLDEAAEEGNEEQDGHLSESSSKQIIDSMSLPQEGRSNATANGGLHSSSESDLDTTSDSSTMTMIEYVRQSNQIISSGIRISPSPRDGLALCLQPLDTRLKVYLESLHSATPQVIALPIALQPLVAITRFSAIQAVSLGKIYQWRRPEVEAILKSFIGTYAAWTREKAATTPSLPDTELVYPVLSNRNCNIVAQLQSTILDSLLLAQSLLLLPDLVEANGRMVNGDLRTAPQMSGRKMPAITHLAPFVFFSGITLHQFLLREKPTDWHWTGKEDRLYTFCLRAFEDGLDEGVVKGWKAPEARNELRSDSATNGMNGLKTGAKPIRSDSGRIQTQSRNQRYADPPHGRAVAVDDWRNGSTGRFDVLKNSST